MALDQLNARKKVDPMKLIKYFVIQQSNNMLYETTYFIFIRHYFPRNDIPTGI